MTRLNSLRGALALGLLLAAVSAAFAQQQPAPPQTDQNDPQARRERIMRGPRGPRPMRERGERGPRPGREQGPGSERRVLRQLDLTDAQRQQLRDVESRYAETFRTRREELRKLQEARRGGGALSAEQQARVRQLREEMRANADRMRGEIQNLLTAEQRTQIQQRREQMKQRGEQLRGRRDELRQRRRQRIAPPPPGSNE